MEPGLTTRCATRCRRDPLAFAVTPSGRRAVATALDGTVELLDPGLGVHMADFEGHTGAATAAATTTAVVSPDGRRIVVGDEDGGVRVRDVDTGSWVARAAVGARPVRFLALPADGDRIVTVHGDRAVRVLAREREVPADEDDGVFEPDPVETCCHPEFEVHVDVEDGSEFADMPADPEQR